MAEDHHTQTSFVSTLKLHYANMHAVEGDEDAFMFARRASEDALMNSAYSLVIARIIMCESVPRAVCALIEVIMQSSIEEGNKFPQHPALIMINRLSLLQIPLENSKTINVLCNQIAMANDFFALFGNSNNINVNAPATAIRSDSIWQIYDGR